MTFSEFKKRLVFKAGVFYLSLAWLLVQIIATLTPLLDLPAILVSGLAFMFIMGYPFVMLMAWAYELTHKTRGWEAVEKAGAKHNISNKVFYGVVYGMLALSLTILLVDIFFLRRPAPTDALYAPAPGGNPVAVADAVPAQQKSIAVLSFADLSEDQDQGYFADGLSRDLVYRLAMVPGLQVTGRGSSLHYRDQADMLNLVGKTLPVENILVGSVRKTGSKLRVTARLVDAGDGVDIWSGSYDRELDAVFAIQHEIVDAVATALSVTPGAGEFDVPGMTRNIEAFDKTLQALALYNRFSPDSVFRAINLMEEAVRLDPGYGRGWLYLGDFYEDSQQILSRDQAEGFPVQAARAYGRAATIAPDMPELMLVEAGSLRNQGLFMKSEALYRQYFDQYGYSVPRALQEYARMLGRTGQFNEAIAMLGRARRQEPLNPRYTYQLALHEMYRGQLDKVRDLAESGLSLEGGDFLFRAMTWELAMREGELGRAAQLIRSYYAGHEPSAFDATVSRRFMAKLADILALNDFDESSQDIIAMINDPAITPLELRYVARLVAIMGQPEIALDYWFGEEADPAIWDKVYADMRRLPDFSRLLEEKGLLGYWRNTGDWGDFCVPAAGLDFVCK